MKTGRPRVDAPTPEQWDVIIPRLAARTTTVRNALTWLHNNGHTMSQPSFERMLHNERKTRNSAGEREAALAATPAVLMLDAVPLAGASFAEEGATLPPAAHGALVAPAEPTVDDTRRAPHMSAPPPPACPDSSDSCAVSRMRLVKWHATCNTDARGRGACGRPRPT